MSRIIACAKSALITHFVPRFVRFAATSREEVQERHTSDLAVSLFSNFLSDYAILILDGIYIYIQKSTRNKVQRRCYSMHKHRPLVKLLVIVTTTSYIISIIGPFFADGKNNGASILRHILDTNVDGIKEWLQERAFLFKTGVFAMYSTHLKTTVLKPNPHHSFPRQRNSCQHLKQIILG